MTEAAASRAPEAAPGHVRSGDGLLGAVDVRALAAQVGLRPTKTRGQNFVIDANTVRRIVRVAAIRPEDVVLEVGPGLGSLTLGLLAQAQRVVAVEIDPVLGAALPETVAARRPDLAGRLTVVTADALRLERAPGTGAVRAGGEPAVQRRGARAAAPARRASRASTGCS